jgi:hypothetical protein
MAALTLITLFFKNVENFKNKNKKIQRIFFVKENK